MVLDEDMFKAFRLCLHHKMSSPSAVKYLYGFEEDLIRLCDEINGRTYRPSTSTTFVVTSPKPREVFAANFRDRIIHHYIAMRIEPLFEEMFTPRTFNCRKEKGVLYGINQLRQDVYDCSEGYTHDCWIMKLDLSGFFMSIDKQLLDRMLQKFIEEHYNGEDKEDVLWLTHITVMHCPEKDCTRISPIEMWDLIADNKSLFTNGDMHGLPIGNLSSQHFANFLLHRLDIAIEKLGFKYHGRRSAFLMEFLSIFGYDTPALTAAAAYGWLPSGGEMTLISANREAINAKLEELGGTAIGEGKYWTSQKYSNDRMWHCDMTTGDFGIALGTSSTGNVRAVRK